MSVTPELLPDLDPPFLLEEALLAAGDRRVVQLLAPSAARLGAAAADGWTVSPFDGGERVPLDQVDPRAAAGGHVSAFVGHKVDVDRALVLHDIVWRAIDLALRASFAELQRQLGYPPCCIGAYVGSDDYGDAPMLTQVAGLSPKTDLPAVNNIFVMEHRLIPHWPCRFDCEASAAQGRTALALVEAAQPQRGAALRALLTSPLVAWDRLRFVMTHPEAGDITAERITRAPVVIDSEPFGDFHAALPDRPDGGHSLHFSREP
ncbi:MAG: hypothetical protein QF464_00785 [Myxococcota bacterium]|nr:hypothetical protein [Myxococcota bacterium]